MKTRNIFSQLILAMACIWLLIAFSGCTSSNSISSLNPTAADPESSINVGGKTASDTTTLEMKPVVNVYASKTVVGPGAEIDLRAEAIDPAGGQVSLVWESTEGTMISTTGSTAIWKAPSQTSAPKIACVATDVRGKSAKAELSIDVVGNATYRLVINADRSSLLTSRITSDAGNPYVPVAGARVEMQGFGEVGVTDAAGMVEFNIDQSSAVATGSQILVKYYDWEISYTASLAVPEGMRIVDSLTFSPGYEGITVAIARGDSFTLKRGMLEVTALENNAGELKPVAEVYVDAGSGQAVSAQIDGRAILSSSNVGNSEVSLKMARNGYQTIEGYNVPVAIDGLTLVRARMARAGSVSSDDAVITWTKPYNSQTAFPVSGPFTIGFGQAMEKATIFNSISMMIQNKNTGSLIGISGAEIARHFRIEWVGNNVLKMYLNTNLQPSTRYSLLISKWEARAADGRILKSYDGIYGEFVTDIDPLPSIVSTSPKNGDTDVGRNGPFSIKFDRSMLPSSLYDGLEIEITSLDSGSRLVLDGQSIKSHFSVTWKDSNKTVELVPYRMLRAKASYLIRLKKCGLVSESGKKASGFEQLWGQFKTAPL